MHLYVRYRELVYAESMHGWGLPGIAAATVAVLIGWVLWSRRA
jgi:hypothetical protein